MVNEIKKALDAPTLTEAEARAAVLAVKGFTNAEIGLALGYAEGSVANIFQRIKDKTGLGKRDIPRKAVDALMEAA